MALAAGAGAALLAGLGALWFRRRRGSSPAPGSSEPASSGDSPGWRSTPTATR